MDSTAPLVSVGIPLFKSARFLNILIGNLDSLTYPNLEFLISDRHCLDDALDVLEARYDSDSRFHFFRAHDELNWVQHYRLLMQLAFGAYFNWMPHDDTFPANYFEMLVGALQKYPDAMLAAGGTEVVYPDGSREILLPTPPFSNDTPW